MGFRDPITTASDVDTRTTIGTPGFWTTESVDDAGNTTNTLHLSDGFSGDTEATITRTAAVNPRSQARAQSIGLAVAGGSLGATPAPELDLNVELQGDGSALRVARLNHLDRFRTSPDGTTWHYRLSGEVTGTTDGNGIYTFNHGGDGDHAPTSWGMQLAGQATDPLNLLLRVIAWGQSATTLSFRASRIDTNTWFAGTPVHVFWWADF